MNAKNSFVYKLSETKPLSGVISRVSACLSFASLGCFRAVACIESLFDGEGCFAAPRTDMVKNSANAAIAVRVAADLGEQIMRNEAMTSPWGKMASNASLQFGGDFVKRVRAQRLAGATPCPMCAGVAR